MPALNYNWLLLGQRTQMLQGRLSSRKLPFRAKKNDGPLPHVSTQGANGPNSARYARRRGRVHNLMTVRSSGRPPPPLWTAAKSPFQPSASTYPCISGKSPFGRRHSVLVRPGLGREAAIDRKVGDSPICAHCGRFSPQETGDIRTTQNHD
jgi:hypothetical protein